MNTRKTVYNKLFKEETKLASHEVQLATVEDLQNKWSELYKKHLGKASSLISEAKNEYRTFIDQIEIVAKEGVDIAKKAKEIGVNVDSIPNYNDIMKKIARDKQQAFEDLTKTLAKYR